MHCDDKCHNHLIRIEKLNSSKGSKATIKSSKEIDQALLRVQQYMEHQNHYDMTHEQNIIMGETGGCFTAKVLHHYHSCSALIPPDHKVI